MHQEELFFKETDPSATMLLSRQALVYTKAIVNTDNF